MDKDVRENTLISIANNTYRFIVLVSIVNALNAFFKRFFDIIVGLVGTVILIPTTVLLFIIKKIVKEDGKMFYIQYRIGKNGKIFKMYKYRTMIDNSEEILNKLLDEDKKIKEEYERYKKIKKDPRITKFGKFLRSTSIDELPQFINILIGSMSMVGPRPYLPKEINDMGYYYYYIIKSKPGLTGLWQISGRNNCTFGNRLELDREYTSHNNVIKDIKIVLKTISGVCKREGAL